MKDKLIVSLLKAVATLPFWALYAFSDIAAFVLYHIVKYRRKVVRQNLVSSFPDKSLKEIKQIEKEFYRFLGDQIIETLKLLQISPEALKKRVVIKNFEEVNRSVANGKNAVLLLGHYCNWEWVQEITRVFDPKAYMASIYHPLSNKAWDDLFIKLRSRWGAHIVAMNKAPRVLLNKDNSPWICGFIADAFTAHKHEDNHIEFLNHKTWFITGPEVIGEKTGADYFYLKMTKISRGRYEINFRKLIPENSSDTFPHLREFWKEFQSTIEEAPAYWLWSHKRWK